MAKQADIAEKETSAKQTAAVRPAFFSTAPSYGWLYGIAAIFILLIVFMLGAALAHSRWNGPQGYNTAVYRGFGPMHMMDGERGFDSGGQAAVNGQTRLRGVVTSVNGNSFTVAGNGSTTNVTTNSSTQYQNGNTVKQNDSVVILGTENNNMLTATRITINP